MSSESVIYYLNHRPDNDPIDETEWLSSALARYTSAELRELLYVGEEPDFFELIRALFALPDHTRAVLQDFLARADPQTIRAAIEPSGRCVLDRDTGENRRGKLALVAN